MIIIAGKIFETMDKLMDCNYFALAMVMLFVFIVWVLIMCLLLPVLIIECIFYIIRDIIRAIRNERGYYN